MKKLLTLLTAVILTLPACAFSSDYPGAKEAVKETVKIVIKIENKKGQHAEALCSGVIIGPNEILTAGHCVNAGPYKIINIWVRDVDGLSQPAFVVKTVPHIDLALLEIVLPEKHYASYTTHLKVGDRVEAVGMPLDLEWNSTFGHVSALGRTFKGERHPDEGSYTQFDAAVNGGNSGGGLWDAHGRLVGIVTAHITPCWFGSWSGLSLAVDMKTILEFLAA
jgi:S1-C subfamily serine protease